MPRTRSGEGFACPPRSTQRATPNPLKSRAGTRCDRQSLARGLPAGRHPCRIPHLLALFAGLAVAADNCPTRPDPDRFHDKVEAVKERVAFARPDLNPVLDELQLIADECIQGPAYVDDLASLQMARGAYALLADGDPIKSEFHFRNAAALTGAKANEPLYGPEVSAALIAILAEDTRTAVLDITFQWEPVVLVLDGEVHYQYGPNDIPAGWHLVQWKAEDLWFSQAVQLKPGGRVHVGDGIPSKDETQIGELVTEETRGGRKKDDAASDDLMVEVRTGNRKGREKRERPQTTLPPVLYAPVEDPGLVTAFASYHVARATVGVGTSTYDGLVGSPDGRVRLRYGKRFRVVAEAGIGAPSGEGRASLSTRARVYGAVAGGPDWTWQLSAGPVLGFLPGTIVPPTPEPEPVFAGTVAVGAGGELSVQLPVVELHARGAWLGGAIEAGVGGTYRYALDPVELRVGLEARTLTTATDRYLGGAATAGVALGF